MFDFSWSEILLIGVVALVVIGPKDLPRVLRTVGQWMGRARGIAREFQFQIDQMVRDSELDDVRKAMNAASGDMHKTISDFVDPTGEIEKSVATPELLGETPMTPLTTPPAGSAPVVAAEPEQLALPTIDAPVPAFLQPVLGTHAPEPIPAVVETPVPRVEAEPIAAEPKSGTHG